VQREQVQGQQIPRYDGKEKRACPVLITAEASPAPAHVYDTLSLQAIPQTATATKKISCKGSNSSSSESVEGWPAGRLQLAAA
jgi:hypothetical protein